MQQLKKLVIVGDSNAIDFSELRGMIFVLLGKWNRAFFASGKEDAMKLAHPRTCDTAVATLKRA